jgi:hypothetical protein
MLTSGGSGVLLPFDPDHHRELLIKKGPLLAKGGEMGHPVLTMGAVKNGAAPLQ